MASHANASANANRRTAESFEDCDARGMIWLLWGDKKCAICILGCDNGYAIWHHVLTPQLMGYAGR